MSKVTLPPDPWQKVTTLRGLPADEVISGLQKCLRRGLGEKALPMGYQHFMTEASRVENRIAGIDTSYRDRIMAAIAAGELS